MQAYTAKKINAGFLALIVGILAAAFFYQWLYTELPCPLCLFQRTAFLAMAVGFLLNDRFGIKPAHYAISMLGALFGLLASMRQILLHILPGDKGYGTTFLGLHFYTWSFVFYFLFMVAMALMMLATQSFAHESQKQIKQEYNWVMKSLALLVLLMALANLVSTFFECGLGACPDNPTHYRLDLKDSLQSTLKK